MQQLPSAWVESLFARLQVRYGAAWTRMWEGVEIAAVKADWAEELAGYVNAPDAIKHALGHLPPDRPPTVSQFAALCRNAPRYIAPALPAPTPDPAVVAAVLGAIRPVAAHDPKAWARRLRKRDQLCERLSLFQRFCWREALKTELVSEARPVVERVEA